MPCCAIHCGGQSIYLRSTSRGRNCGRCGRSNESTFGENAWRAFLQYRKTKLAKGCSGSLRKLRTPSMSSVLVTVKRFVITGCLLHACGGGGGKTASGSASKARGVGCLTISTGRT